MQEHELTAWLGGAAEKVTAEQLTALLAAANRIERRWPHPRRADLREAALDGAARVILLGDATLETIAATWRAACSSEIKAHAALTGALIASTGTEATLARRVGVTRVTVRKALGK